MVLFQNRGEQRVFAFEMLIQRALGDTGGRCNLIHKKLAIGTSAAIGLPLSLAGALAYGWEGWGVSGDQWAVGYIDIPAALALVLGTLLTVRLGVATAHWLPSRALASLFALFLTLNGAHLLYSALR